MKKLLSLIFAVLLLVAACVGFRQADDLIDRSAREIVSPKHLRSRQSPTEVLAERTYTLPSGQILSAATSTILAKPKAVILLLHGHGDVKESYANLLVYLAKLNIQGIAIDMRAHGKSGGLYGTFGYYEKNDLSKILDQIESEHPTIPVGLWGFSYGGAVAIQSAANDTRFDFLIAESTFANLPDVIADYGVKYTGFLPRFISDYTLRRAGRIASFDPWEVSPEKAAKNIRIPFLHFHGTADPWIFYTYAERIGRNTNPKWYNHVAIPGGDHGALGQTAKELYYRELEAFLDQVTR
jgi:uncharacterized protein